MESLARNGSYVQRRKMYIEFPLHNMKSKVPIDWQSDLPSTYERHRSIAREINEKEYIKRIYDQKMDRKIREKYIGTDVGERRNQRRSETDDGRDVLSKEIQQFNSSKVGPSLNHKNNPENAQQYNQPQTPAKEGSLSSSKPSSRQKPEENYRKDKNNYQNDKEPYQRERRYSERQRSFDGDRQRNRQWQQGHNNSQGPYPYDRQQPYNFDDRGQERSFIEYQRNPKGQPYNNPNAPQHSPMLYRGESDMNSNQYRPPYYISSPRYNPPYQDQNQYSYDGGRLRHQPSSLPNNSNHPFRNALPDRLEEFLREKTKADRKSAITVSLKNS